VDKDTVPTIAFERHPIRDRLSDYYEAIKSAPEAIVMFAVTGFAVIVEEIKHKKPEECSPKEERYFPAEDGRGYVLPSVVRVEEESIV
jgi:hypothetical protein